MKFNHFERIWMNNLLPLLVPQQNSRFIYKVWDGFAKEVSFTEKELKYLQMKFEGEEYKDEKGKKKIVPPGSTVWNPKKTIDKNIAIPEVIEGIIIRRLQELDKNGDLPKEAVIIFDKFIDESKWFKEEEEQKNGKNKRRIN